MEIRRERLKRVLNEGRTRIRVVFHRGFVRITRMAIWWCAVILEIVNRPWAPSDQLEPPHPSSSETVIFKAWTNSDYGENLRSNTLLLHLGVDTMMVFDYYSTSKLHFSSECLKATCFLSGLPFCSFIRMFTENDCFVYISELNAVLMLLEIIMHICRQLH